MNRSQFFAGSNSVLCAMFGPELKAIIRQYKNTCRNNACTKDDNILNNSELNFANKLGFVTAEYEIIREKLIYIGIYWQH